MGTTVGEVYEHAREKYRLRLLGGKAGLCNPVHWIYIAEDIQNLPFLKGGELAITTGLFTQSGVSASDFVQKLALHKCSGLVVNVGKYVRPADVTPEIVAFCDRCGFPLMTMPWDVHLVDVMQDISFLLMQNVQSGELLSATLQNALYQEPVQDNALRLLERYGFPVRAAYRLALMRNVDNPADVTRELNASGLKYHLFPHETLWALLYRVPEEKPVARKAEELPAVLGGIRAGFSDVLPGLEEIGRGYRQARFALAAAEYRRCRSARFEDLGLLQILFSVTDTRRLEAVRQRRLGALEQYDLAHRADLTETLRTFLVCGGVVETARRLHAHRNTIVYRLARIREIVGDDLDDSDVRFELLTAFSIREFFSIRG